MHTQKTSQSRLAFANLLAGATLSNYNHSLQKCKKIRNLTLPLPTLDANLLAVPQPPDPPPTTTSLK